MSGLVSFLRSEFAEPSQITYYVLGTLIFAFVIQRIFRIAQNIKKRFRDADALKDFPGPKLHWFFGDIRNLLKLEEKTDYTLDLIRRFPKGCVSRMDPFRVHLRLYHPDDLKAIMATSEPKDPFGYRFLIPWIGEGLLISKGHHWARNRRLLTPAFHFDILKPYVTIFSQSANTMVNKWKSILSKKNEPLEMFEHVSLMTLDSLMKCIFGFQGDCQIEGFRHPYITGVYDLAYLVVRRMLFFPYHADSIYHLTWSGYKFRHACKLVHKFSQEVIEQKRKEHQQKDGKTKSKTIDFMDMLLEARDEDGVGLTDAEIQAEVDTFMFEGHDTTASGVSWSLYHLAKHPEFQAKCRDEVNSVLGDRENLTWDDVHNLPFLTMFIKESLRMVPPVPVIGRETTKPLTFADGRTIPAGITLLISIFGCHHHPDVWKDPEVFDPYRFTPENSEGRSPHAFVPFSAGPRNCIGQQFALHEMKASISQVLRHFELSLEGRKRPIKEGLLIMRAKDGLYVNVKPIQH